MSTTPAFNKLWWTVPARDALISRIPKEDLGSFRLACRDFAVKAAPYLFEELTINFRPSTFTKPARLAALERVGPCVQKVRFSMPHTPDSFLPPLIDPETGEEVEFVYEPYCQPTSRLSVPTYGSWELTDLLVKQYPPLFHASANIPSFIAAFTALKNIVHLEVSTPGQDPLYRYRRCAVDYALISLRIAVERSHLPMLEALTLDAVHPSAALHLNPIMGPGARPNSTRRWRQIKSLSITMSALPLEDSDPTDHLKHLHSYLHLFSETLTSLDFTWLGERKGPFPLALTAEPRLAHSPTATSPTNACPRRCHIALRPLRMARLQRMQAFNVATSALQVQTFILAHRRTVTDFAFERTDLRDGEDWEEALEPLTAIAGGDDSWKRAVRRKEVMEVPLMLSPADADSLNAERRRSIEEKVERELGAAELARKPSRSGSTSSSSDESRSASSYRSARSGRRGRGRRRKGSFGSNSSTSSFGKLSAESLLSAVETELELQAGDEIAEREAVKEVRSATTPLLLGVGALESMGMFGGLEALGRLKALRGCGGGRRRWLGNTSDVRKLIRTAWTGAF